ncbi:glycosyltransferase, partial [candidate division GN15 bacterium]|nr:glycosyltransferase [candidate division GN15 bacterium]
EAASQSVPSIAGRAGGVPDAVRDGETGLLVRPGSVDELAEAINRLRNDTVFRRALGERAREHARSFSWDTCARETFGGRAKS